MINLAVIGVGGLGARHLESIGQMKIQAKVQVVDVSKESLDKAKTIFESTRRDNIASIDYYTDINNIDANLDVCIIATSSLVRRKVMEELFRVSKVKYMILEKVLFPTVKDYADMSDLIKKNNCKVWVNCSRRLWEDIPTIKDYLKNEEFIHFHVFGGNWGLGCNSIHFIDSFAYYTDSLQGYEYDISMLSDEIIESKRQNYLEFTGTLKGKTDKCSFEITSFDGQPSPITITMASKNVRIILLEGEGRYLIAKTDNMFKYEQHSLAVPFQSQLTAPLIQEIIESGECNLVNYEDSCMIHVPFIKALLRHINNQKEGGSKICPIT